MIFSHLSPAKHRRGKKDKPSTSSRADSTGKRRRRRRTTTHGHK
ncbi:hypothetical protein [Streptomyces sp. NPDC005408]